MTRTATGQRPGRPRLLPIALSIALLGAGCAQGPGQPGVPLAAQGCAVGGAAGAGVGGLAARSWGAAGIGALVGCGVGAVAGLALQASQTRYAGAEQGLTERTAAAHQQASDLRTEARLDLDTSARIERSMSPLVQQVAAGRALGNTELMELSRARAERTRVAEQLRRGQEQLKTLSADIYQMQKAGWDIKQPAADRSSIERSILDLERALDRMDRAIGQIQA